MVNPIDDAFSYYAIEQKFYDIEIIRMFAAEFQVA